MNRLDALKELAAKVEVGAVEYPFGWATEGYKINNLFPHRDLVHGAYKGSIDAALALHEAVLPGFHYSIDSEDRNGVCVFDHLMGNAQVAHSETASRAWLLAILRALIAQEEDQ